MGAMFVARKSCDGDGDRLFLSRWISAKWDGLGEGHTAAGRVNNFHTPAACSKYTVFYLSQSLLP
jgi:hypothetical protein